MVLDETTQGIKDKQGALLLWQAEVQKGTQPQGLELRVQQVMGQLNDFSHFKLK